MFAHMTLDEQLLLRLYFWILKSTKFGLSYFLVKECYLNSGKELEALVKANIAKLAYYCDFERVVN